MRFNKTFFAAVIVWTSVSASAIALANESITSEDLERDWLGDIYFGFRGRTEYNKVEKVAQRLLKDNQAIVCTFSIGVDGRIANLELSPTHRSESFELNQLILKMIRKSSPLRKPPANLGNEIRMSVACYTGTIGNDRRFFCDPRIER